MFIVAEYAALRYTARFKRLFKVQDFGNCELSPMELSTEYSSIKVFKKFSLELSEGMGL